MTDNFRHLKRLGYRTGRWLIGKIARPQLASPDLGADVRRDQNPVYVLEARSLSDLIILDLICEQHQLTSPLDPVDSLPTPEARRFFFLNRAAGGPFRKNTMQTYSERMVRLVEHPEQTPSAMLLPVAVFWGRSPSRKEHILHGLFSENWAVTSRLKRALNLFISRHHIVVSFGPAVALADLERVEPARRVRHAARLLRVRLRNQRAAVLGPDLSHQRTLVNQVLTSRSVQQVLENKERSSESDLLKNERKARKAALSIVSNMSMGTVRVLEKLLQWFWHRIYNGLQINGLANVVRSAETHTLVYVPSHRSHIDYLLLSFVLFRHGLMIPHIAAGDNLNLPILGAILRRGGAFFMRRSFRNDAIYSAVFSEYLYQVYRRGHSVEFFLEGGRSRTGRLLPAKLGLVKMTLDNHERGVPRPLAFVPVYFGYEKLVEANSYLSELRGSEKRGESMADLFRSLKLIRQNFGQVQINFGDPLPVAQWVAEYPEPDSAERLGRELLIRINEAAAINPVNLVALATLSTPHSAIDETQLEELIDGFLRLLRMNDTNQAFTLPDLSARKIIQYVEQLGMLSREEYEFGDVLCHQGTNAILMTWYRNNVAHTLALPALIAALVYRRRRPISKLALVRMIDTVQPYIAEELTFRVDLAATDRWLSHLVRSGLLEIHANGGYSTPASNTPEHNLLRFLANIIMPTLERLYIVIALLNHRETRTRSALQNASQSVAHKMSRIYGLNAPEFFDARLFNLFIDKLIVDQQIEVDEDGNISHSQLFVDILRAAESVIDPEFRYALMREQ
jgi:glycerol-3-phosphate O-acyltransferase